MKHRILSGHLLGDGHITKHEVGNSYLATHRKAEHHSLNLWLKEQLQNDGIKFTDTYPKKRMSGGKSHPSSYLRSCRSEFWSEMRDLWYPQGERRIPQEYVSEHFDELSLALLFADNGDKQGRISCDWMTKDEIYFVKDLFEGRFGLRLKIWHQHNREEHMIIAVPKSEKLMIGKYFRSLIGVPELSYKFE